MKGLSRVLCGSVLLCSFSFFLSVLAEAEKAKPEAKPEKKPWNFMLYMCNNNDLHKFGVQNFRQLVKVGSSKNTNLLLQMDEFGEKEITRFFVEKDNPIIVETQSDTPTSFSGTPDNLFEFGQWGINGYPAKKQCLVLWNHGAGIKDPNIWGRTLLKMRDRLFTFNRKNGLLELNRAYKQEKNLLDAYKHLTENERGIAFNDTAETYLTNEDLKNSLDNIVKNVLGGQKLHILAMDACFMGMIEVASQVQTAAKYLVASEEVEPGAGYNYCNVLKPLIETPMKAKDFARHIVASYENEYQKTMNDFTQSAINLKYIPELEKAMTQLSDTLVSFLEKGGKSARKMLKVLRQHKDLTTEFFDSDYIDLQHFIVSLLDQIVEYAQNSKSFPSHYESAPEPLGAQERGTVLKITEQIKDAATDILNLLEKAIMANTAGKNLEKAAGLSIYFPTSKIHGSYYKTEFAKTTTWINFLEKYLNL